LSPGAFPAGASVVEPPPLLGFAFVFALGSAAGAAGAGVGSGDLAGAAAGAVSAAGSLVAAAFDRPRFLTVSTSSLLPAKPDSLFIDSYEIFFLIFCFYF
jgi:hypothetical protein